MKKRLCSLLLALVMLGALVIGAMPAMAAEEEGVTIRLHYAREDGNYDDWDVWIWYTAGTTAFEGAFKFQSENGEMVATVPVSRGALKVGYIVRRGGDQWTEKDIAEDQFIDIAGVISGTLDVYVQSGVKGHRVVEGIDILVGTVIVNAIYKEKNRDGVPEMIVQMSNRLEDAPVTTETFTVYNNKHTVAITAVKEVNAYYYLTLSEPLNLFSTYLVGYREIKAAATMPNVYNTKEFEERFTYEGDDLGFIYTPQKTKVRVWVPLAEGLAIKLYRSGDPEKDPEAFSRVEMTQDVKGTWICELEGDMQNTYYTFEVTYATHVTEGADPYSRSTGVNGHRSMIFDLDATDPEGWENDCNPNANLRPTDMIIMESNIQDLTCDPSSGVTHQGMYLGLTETGTTTPDGDATVLDYFKRMKITHLHLLPVFDYGKVDESQPREERAYNWGYNPVHYNVPDGNYASDPNDGTVRVKEFKQMVQALHNNGISVVMDVVYNHVDNAAKFCFNQLVPDYFTRPGSQGSGCGNDVASERSMVRKYIVDSVNYWVDEYHIDGFRFDLVGILDTETVNEIINTVHEKRPDVVFYGEGWQMPTKLSKAGYTLATQFNSALTPDLAFFSDTTRNAVKGGTYNGVSAGFISGGNVSKDELNACFKGMPDWCNTPSQCVNYISCHDNNTLFDHITMVAKNATLQQRYDMNKLGAAFILMAQGIPFFQVGEDMARSKPKEGGGYDDNSHASPISVNSVKWGTLSDPNIKALSDYYAGLAEFRHAHPALRMDNAAEVDAKVRIIEGLPAGVVAYNVLGGQEGETANSIYCAFNANQSATTITLPEGEWDVHVDNQAAGTEVLRTVSGVVELPAISAMVLVPHVEPPIPEPVIPLWVIITMIAAAIVVVAVAVSVALIIKKKR